jgi:hypothetical protein
MAGGWVGVSPPTDNNAFIGSGSAVAVDMIDPTV